MRIHRSHPDENFTILPNATLQDDRLSFVALGILCQLISRPADWSITADGLWQQKQRQQGKKTGQGREAIRAAFAELEKLGYLVRRKTKGEGGQWVTILDLYDTPSHHADEAAEPSTNPWDAIDAKRAAEEQEAILNRGTEYRASEDRLSGDRASANAALLQSTEAQRDIQSTGDKDFATLADARVGALASAENLDAKSQAALAWGLADAEAEAQRKKDRADAHAARYAELKKLYDAVDRLNDHDLRNALLKFERERKRIYRDSRNDAIDQIREENADLLKADDASHRIDNLSYKYGLKHYHDEDREWPAFLIRPLLPNRGRAA